MHSTLMRIVMLAVQIRAAESQWAWPETSAKVGGRMVAKLHWENHDL